MVAFNSVAAAFSLAFFALAVNADNLDDMLGKGSKPLILGSAPTGTKPAPDAVITATGLRYIEVTQPMFVRPGEQTLFTWRPEVWNLSMPIADLPIGTQFQELVNVTVHTWNGGSQSEIVARIIENKNLDGASGITWDVPADIEERDDYFLDIGVKLVSDDVKVVTQYWNSFGSSENFNITKEGSDNGVIIPFRGSGTTTSPESAKNSPVKEDKDSSAPGLVVRRGLSWVAGALATFTLF
ncbi:hypothetical protein BJ508DRAFT_419654 [Ascobolus immersus RN42]|uniref:Uncharacterized protein n=1 Tax=Ascobolus immersus RN42 TaxID=1160509 RepID=A0A3N4HCI6_ASCIM|nr:hypothetical protein BJ508DRAFT_419654 [Ascobolus immersus RN42]